jgi:hypothetical protein
VDEKWAAAVKVFDKDVGEWDVELSVTPPGNAPANHTTGRATTRLLGGRWLVTDYRTDQGFEGHGVWGWDPSLGKYVGTWVDPMLSSPARSVGTWDPDTRTMTFQVETTHEGRTIRYRETTTTLADGSLEYKNLIPVPDGTEHQMIRSVYRRRAS